MNKAVKNIEAEVASYLENYEQTAEERRKARKARLADPARAEVAAEIRERLAIAEELYKARKEAKLTQAELAARMNVSQPYIAKMERGRGNISYEAITRYAKACDKRAKLILV